jgi:NAD-dependent SIR2 family protein deacetylase
MIIEAISLNDAWQTYDERRDTKDAAKMLQSSAPSLHAKRQIVGCPHCHTKYALTRRETPPGIVPVCDGCGQEFAPRENDSWLIYERVEVIE